MKSHHLNMSQTRIRTFGMLMWIGRAQEPSTLHKEWLRNGTVGGTIFPREEHTDKLIPNDQL